MGRHNSFFWRRLIETFLNSKCITCQKIDKINQQNWIKRKKNTDQKILSGTVITIEKDFLVAYRTQSNIYDEAFLGN